MEQSPNHVFETDVTPAVAARGLLRPRIKRVERLARRLAEATELPERHVHKIRVSVRDAVAALHAFAPALPRKQARRLRKSLRTIRKAAGDARRCDVLTPIVAARVGSSTAEVAAAGGYLLARLEADRRQARRALRDSLRDFDIKALKRRRKQLLRRIADPDGGVPAIANEAIHRAREDVRTASDSDLTDTANLHALRIACKRLRYTLEAFEGDVGGAGGALATLRETQDRLGRFNDICDAMDLVEREIKRARADRLPSSLVTGLTWIRVGLIDERNALRASFLLWWRNARRRILPQDELDGSVGDTDVALEGTRRERA
jgi:CHAD domain-containing protein